MAESILIFFLKILWGFIFVGLLILPFYLIGAFAYALWLDHKRGKNKGLIKIRGHSNSRKEANKVTPA